MCGIVAAAAGNNIVPVLVEGLKTPNQDHRVHESGQEGEQRRLEHDDRNQADQVSEQLR